MKRCVRRASICANTYIFDAESLDFIVSIWHQVSQGDSKATSIKGVIHIVSPVLLTFALRRGIVKESWYQTFHLIQALPLQCVITILCNGMYSDAPLSAYP